MFVLHTTKIVYMLSRGRRVGQPSRAHVKWQCRLKNKLLPNQWVKIGCWNFLGWGRSPWGGGSRWHDISVGPRRNHSWSRWRSCPLGTPKYAWILSEHRKEICCWKRWMQNLNHSCSICLSSSVNFSDKSVNFCWFMLASPSSLLNLYYLLVTLELALTF